MLLQLIFSKINQLLVIAADIIWRRIPIFDLLWNISQRNPEDEMEERLTLLSISLNKNTAPCLWIFLQQLTAGYNIGSDLW